MIGAWLGQVGVPTNTRACGFAVAISSKPSRSAPQPPGVCKPAIRSSAACWPEQDRPQQLGEALVARAAEIGLGDLRIDEALLGLLDHLRIGVLPAESRNTPTPTSILSGRGSALAKRDQRKQRIVRRRAEDRQGPWPWRGFAVSMGCAIS